MMPYAYQLVDNFVWSRAGCVQWVHERFFTESSYLLEMMQMRAARLNQNLNIAGCKKQNNDLKKG